MLSIDTRIKTYDSPIELELQRIANILESVRGSSYQTCDKCGEKERVFSNLMEGTFTCLRCYMKKEAERLYTDPEWMKKEKVWKMRKAREARQRYYNGIQRNDEQRDNL